MVAKHHYFFQRLKRRARLNVDHMRRGCRIGFHFNHAPDHESRRINFVLPRCHNRIALRHRL